MSYKKTSKKEPKIIVGGIDIYEQKKLKLIKKFIKDDNALITIINKIYEEGFFDGVESCK